eukprot:CAMPEP_0194122200 /NCGR_PEP_ID=MMETSP0150-20130528/49611_1 /TAXON_ID=122233 /ORGANISM="Chaetoceros debilis, Strain MM31A-1" /LENGTH=1546 /DNA_ID=CAMNT_0038814935 /DNA_START=144 /DNA_END=4781 /DNA_ORIENTATION=+
MNSVDSFTENTEDGVEVQVVSPHVATATNISASQHTTGSSTRSYKNSAAATTSCSSFGRRPSSSSSINRLSSASGLRPSSASVFSYSSRASSLSDSTVSTASARKLLTDFIATEPSNRSCADCNCLLIDFTKMHASLVIIEPGEWGVDYDDNALNGQVENGLGGDRDLLNTSFVNHHEAFAPPNMTLNTRTNLKLGVNGDSPITEKRKRRRRVDPRDTAKAIQSIAHGVFICQACSIAHRALSRDDIETKDVKKSAKRNTPLSGKNANNVEGNKVHIIVKSVTLDQWTQEEVHSILQCGGNAASKNILEHYYHQNKKNAAAGLSSSGKGGSSLKRPKGDSSEETRELFVRAKYQALAFVLPNGPGSKLQWGMHKSNILNDGDMSVQVGGIDKNMTKAEAASEVLPDRLVDCFCIVSSNGIIESKPGGSISKGIGASRIFPDLSQLRSPDELCFTTEMTDCFPSHYSPPAHLSKFVFPDGCKPSRNRSSMPTYFTFTLTNENGTKLYGAALHIYDTHMDLGKISDCIQKSGYDGAMPVWLGTKKGSKKKNGGGDGSNIAQYEIGNGINASDSNDSRSSTASTNATKSSSKAAVLTGNQHDLFFLPKCLVVLSHYGFFEVWRKFLLQIYHISIVEAPLPIERYICNFVCEVPLPPMGLVGIDLSFANDQHINISRPPANRLPLVNFSFRPLFTCLSTSNIMVIVGCLLQETRVALCSRHYSLLTPCCEALISFLFPFRYSGIYIPIVPTSMIVDLLEAPVPFLVGLNRIYLEEVPTKRRPKGVVLVDLDEDIIHLGYDESESFDGRLPPFLPEKDAAKLKTSLEHFGGCEYVAPTSGRKGRITYCDGNPLANEKRGSYCRAVYYKSTKSRSEVFEQVDRAFLDNDHLMQIDFAGGTLTGASDDNRSDWKVKGMKKTKPLQSKKKKLTSITKSDQDTHLLDIESQSVSYDPGEIRNSFLRFLVALFRDYGNYIQQSGKEDRHQFSKESFILNSESRSFMSEVVASQMFDIYIEEKIISPDSPSIKFFDDSIVAKRNRSKASVGRRRETAFISDNAGKIVETFIPPAPNSHNISKSLYHYNGFPLKLDHSLFGEIRPPKKLQNMTAQRKLLQRRSRRSTLHSLAVKRRIMSQLLKPYSSSLMHIQKDINWALHAIVYRNSWNPAATKGGNITEDQMVGPELLTKAWSILHNMRSEQILHVVDIICLQKYWLAHRSFPKEILDQKGIEIIRPIRRNWLRPPAIKHSWSSLKSSVTQIQANFRGKQMHILYKAVRYFAIKIQAAVRGHLIKKSIHTEVNQRTEEYREQIVMLWYRAQVPLFYRSRFWILNKLPCFLNYALHEHELGWLYERLGIQHLDGYHSMNDILANTPIRATFAMVKIKLERSNHDQAIFPAEIGAESNIAQCLRLATKQILFERIQIYDRLQNLNKKDDIVGIMGLKETKKKKELLAKSLWGANTKEGVSATVINSLFPELTRSANITVTIPSKKGIVRLDLPKSTKNAIPKPLDRSMQIESKIEALIQKNLVSAARSVFKASDQDRRQCFKTHIPPI